MKIPKNFPFSLVKLIKKSFRKFSSYNIFATRKHVFEIYETCIKFLLKSFWSKMCCGKFVIYLKPLDIKFCNLTKRIIHIWIANLNAFSENLNWQTSKTHFTRLHSLSIYFCKKKPFSFNSVAIIVPLPSSTFMAMIIFVIKNEKATWLHNSVLLLRMHSGLTAVVVGLLRFILLWLRETNVQWIFFITNI